MRIKVDIVEKWLKENDPDYSLNKHYLNNNRFLKIQRRERPVSNNIMDKTDRRACV